MLFRVASDAVVVVHLGFILFVALGGFLTLRWLRVTWVLLATDGSKASAGTRSGPAFLSPGARRSAGSR